MNTCYKHFYYFVTEFDLINEKVDTILSAKLHKPYNLQEFAPLQEMTRKICTDIIAPPTPTGAIWDLLKKKILISYTFFSFRATQASVPTRWISGCCCQMIPLSEYHLKEKQPSALLITITVVCQITHLEKHITESVFCWNSDLDQMCWGNTVKQPRFPNIDCKCENMDLKSTAKSFCRNVDSKSVWKPIISQFALCHHYYT